MPSPKDNVLTVLVSQEGIIGRNDDDDDDDDHDGCAAAESSHCMLGAECEFRLSRRRRSSLQRLGGTGLVVLLQEPGKVIQHIGSRQFPESRRRFE